MIVEEQVHSKTRSGKIKALALLTSVGVDVDGDGGRFGGGGGPGSGGTFSKVVLLTGFEDGADGTTTVVDLSSYHHGAANVRGDAQIDTSQFKYGASSGLFDGSGDALYWPLASEWDLGTTWTIECWVRFNSTATQQAILSNYTGVGFGSTNSWLLYTQGSQKLEFFVYNGFSNTVLIDTATSIFSTGSWYHVAVSSDGTKVRLFLNGVMVGSQTPTSTACGSHLNPVSVGNDGIYTRPLNGWVDEVRITKGYSFYSSDSGFTPPTAAFPRSDTDSSSTSSASTDEDGMMLIF